jgi:hypothetical protein
MAAYMGNWKYIKRAASARATSIISGSPVHIIYDPKIQQCLATRCPTSGSSLSLSSDIVCIRALIRTRPPLPTPTKFGTQAGDPNSRPYPLTPRLRAVARSAE